MIFPRGQNRVFQYFLAILSENEHFCPAFWSPFFFDFSLQVSVCFAFSTQCSGTRISHCAQISAESVERGVSSAPMAEFDLFWAGREKTNTHKPTCRLGSCAALALET